MADLRVNDQEKARVAAALGTTTGDLNFDQRVRELEQLALDEWVDWILSKRRFETTAALDRYRILSLYGAVRRQAPSVESLSNDLDISESRASSLVSRMRYGDARLIRRLAYEAAVVEIEAVLAAVGVHNDRKDVWVTSETGRVIDEANTAILLDVPGRNPGGPYEGAEKAERPSSTRTGQEWVASERMWQLMLGWIRARADQLAN